HRPSADFGGLGTGDDPAGHRAVPGQPLGGGPAPGLRGGDVAEEGAALLRTEGHRGPKNVTGVMRAVRPLPPRESPSGFFQCRRFSARYVQVFNQPSQLETTSQLPYGGAFRKLIADTHELEVTP